MVDIVPLIAVAIAIFLIWLGGSLQRCIYPSVKGQPSSWVFSVVWPILYICIAWAGVKIWKVRDITESKGSIGRRCAYILLLAMLSLWPFVHWYWCAPSFSVIIILLALILSLILLIVMIPKDKIASLLLLPLVLWLSYASILNWRIAKNNL